MTYEQPPIPPPMPQQPQQWIDPGVVRQWESRVTRMIRMGETREQILYAMADANWPHEQADQMVRRLARSERTKAIAMLAGFGLVCLGGLVVTFLTLTSTKPDGGFIGIPVFAAVAAGWGLMRLIKIRA